MKIKKVIGEGYMVPDWYGVAYYSYVSHEMICYPIGLNIIVGILHTLYMEIRRPWFRANDIKYKKLIDESNRKENNNA